MTYVNRLFHTCWELFSSMMILTVVFTTDVPVFPTKLWQEEMLVNVNHLIENYFAWSKSKNAVVFTSQEVLNHREMLQPEKLIKIH